MHIKFLLVSVLVTIATATPTVQKRRVDAGPVDAYTNQCEGSDQCEDLVYNRRQTGESPTVTGTGESAVVPGTGESPGQSQGYGQR